MTSVPSLAVLLSLFFSPSPPSCIRNLPLKGSGKEHHCVPSTRGSCKRVGSRAFRMRRAVRLTRLRTTKHGSEVSGKPVMVHRCQGEYFRQLLKPIT